MNKDSEQITLDKNLLIAQDQPLSPKDMISCVIDILGKENCKEIILPVKRRIIEYRTAGKVYHLLLRACTYLGNPHPIFKKRVQFPPWFRDYTLNVGLTSAEIDVRFVGVYHYEDEFHGRNIILIDFEKSTYLRRNIHNSSAHVYTNDLFQAMNYGIFSKEDAFGNTVTTVRQDKLRKYFTEEKRGIHSLFDLFRKFNEGFSFGEWLTAVETIKEMYYNKWHQWRQAEWAGWFLEYRFNKFTIENDVTNRMRYVGSSLKHEGDLDFDIRFEDEDFYGDLKASDICKKETPGNDQENLIECIYQFNRFWYIIYEHETIKDKDREYAATKGRNVFIKEMDKEYDKDEMSYHSRMKYAVKFTKMTIIELNRINYREILTTFNQGHQPDGSKRRPKFMINKNVLNNENFVVFRYTYNK